MGFLTKDHSPEELEAAIRRVTSGRRYLSPALADALADVVQGKVGRPRTFLAARDGDLGRVAAFMDEFEPCSGQCHLPQGTI